MENLEVLMLGGVHACGIQLVENGETTGIT